MIELHNDSLRVSFPEVHRDAVLDVTFHRTLRIPDDDRDYPLPPSLGAFPLRHVDDYADQLPEIWQRRGGVMLPMYQAEAVWLSFSSPSSYPFAVKVAAGMRNAVTGEAWDDGLSREPQNYLAVPGQPWLDGFVVERGAIRQFVAMPLGTGYSVEEQLTGRAEHGGVQLQVFPLRREVWEREQARSRMLFRREAAFADADFALACEAAPSMGLGAGGRMRQEVYEDHRPLPDWDRQHTSRCFVHLTNALVWRAITGSNPPTVPLTAAEYTRYGFPWFEYYADDLRALRETETLAKIRSIRQLGQRKGEPALPENEAVEPDNVVHLGSGKRSRHEVREGAF